MKQGDHSMTFNIVYSETQEPVVMTYWPMTSGSCYATSSVLHRQTAVRGDCSGGCCRHKGASYEVNTPSNWERLTNAEKKASVTYLFENKASATFDYSTNYPHRIFLFKGSKVLACKNTR